MEPTYKSRIPEEVVADSCIRFIDFRTNKIEKEEDRKQRIQKMIQKYDVKEVFIENIVTVFNQIVSDFKKNENKTEEEKDIPIFTQKHIIEMVETVIQWGVIPNLTKIHVEEDDEEFIGENTFIIKINPKRNTNKLKLIIDSILPNIKIENMNIIIKEYMKYIYAAILDIGLDQSELKPLRPFFDLEISVKSLIQLIIQNTEQRNIIQKELFYLITECNGLIYLLIYFSEKEFQEIPEEMAMFILNQLFIKEDQPLFYSYVLNNYQNLIDSNLLPKNEINLLYFIVLPASQLEDCMNKNAIQPLKRLNHIICQRELTGTKFSFEEREQIPNEIKIVECFINVANVLFDDFQHKLKQTEFNNEMVISIIELVKYYHNSILFQDNEEEIKNSIISLSCYYFKLLEDYSDIIKEIQKNESIIKKEELDHDINEIIQKIYLTLSHEQQIQLLLSWSQVITTENDCIIVITLLNKTKQLKENSTEYINIFHILLEKSPNTNIVMNYINYLMDEWKNSTSIIYHQNTINELLPSIIEKDGSMYSSIIEFLSILPSSTLKSEELERDIENITKNNDNDNMVLLNKLRLELVKQKTLHFNEEKIKIIIKDIINVLLYNTNITLQKLLISNISLISIHINLLPYLLPFINKIDSENSAIVFIELIISILSVKRNEVINEIPSLLNSLLSIKIPHLFPYLSMVFNYLFEFIPTSIYNSLVITYFINLIDFCDFKEESNVNSLLHSLRSLTDAIDINKVTSVFTISQLNKLHSIIVV
ncbi:hypothetical protein ENUP19_0156G0018 [Entamoeba nuttalli]|uniref:Uncharacterized protein n=1 Tax=Entamoeba nuttalli TaxID=412467 RepID=A0ABQ0DL74_9EUKA